MPTNAKPGINTILRKQSMSGWQEIAEVTEISWDGVTREVIEVFKLNNSDDYVNKLQGVQNAGSITATVLFTKAQYLILKTDIDSRSTRKYQIKFPDGEGLEWSGFPSNLSLSWASDDAMQGDLVLEIDGKPNFNSIASVAP